MIINDYVLATKTCDDNRLIKPLFNFEMVNEFMANVCNFDGLVLMNNMSSIFKNFEFEFALHLCNCQFFVDSVATC